MRTCGCCGTPAAVVLNPRKGSGSVEPTLVCHFCDYIKAWPNTQRALRRQR